MNDINIFDFNPGVILRVTNKQWTWKAKQKRVSFRAFCLRWNENFKLISF